MTRSNGGSDRRHRAIGNLMPGYRRIEGVTMRRFPFLTMVLIMATLASYQLSLADQGGATLVGRITFTGDIPPPRVMRVNRDREFCGNTITIQPVTVQRSSHGVASAIVSVEGVQRQPIDEKKPPTIMTITNRHCAFIPRVSATSLGSILEVRSEDPVLHNTHIRLGRRTFLNVAMVPGGPVIRKTMIRPGALSVQCDAHKFMRAFVVAFDHPFFKVTNEAGEFTIAGVPPGRHTMTIWHETLGLVRKEKILVPKSGTVVVNVEYP